MESCTQQTTVYHDVQIYSYSVTYRHVPVLAIAVHVTTCMPRKYLTLFVVRAFYSIR